MPSGTHTFYYETNFDSFCHIFILPDTSIFERWLDLRRWPMLYIPPIRILNMIPGRKFIWRANPRWKQGRWKSLT